MKNRQKLEELIKGNTKSVSEVAKETGYTKQMVSQLAKRFGIKLPKKEREVAVEGIKCIRCGREVIVFKSKIKRKKYYRKGYCSSKCQREENCWFRIKCEACGKEIKLRGSYIRHRTKRKQANFYCSRKCKMTNYWRQKKGLTKTNGTGTIQEG